MVLKVLIELINFNILGISDWGLDLDYYDVPAGTGKFDLGVQNEVGQRLIELCQENALVIANTFFPTTQEKALHMDITRWSTLKSD